MLVVRPCKERAAATELYAQLTRSLRAAYALLCWRIAHLFAVGSNHGNTLTSGEITERLGRSDRARRCSGLKDANAQKTLPRASHHLRLPGQCSLRQLTLCHNAPERSKCICHAIRLSTCAIYEGRTDTQALFKRT